MRRRAALAVTLVAVLLPAALAGARPTATTGVSATEIVLGGTAPLTGPANSRRLPSGRVTTTGAGAAGLSDRWAAEDWCCIVPLWQKSTMAGLAEGYGCDNHVTCQPARFKPSEGIRESSPRPFADYRETGLTEPP